ncbi:hypothetical protein [Paenibacillus alkalitolerans]|uniref:hypothetical protein n=1 Tax=Paenibacillus alkalitolerans TaxID=2799335 RepID=UPI001F450B41|nr:hypothetical protein [Paenibacillus alkalitolerans]
MKESINNYERSVFSQNGEDGILEIIFSRIGTKHNFFVEFGVGDGIQCNARYLVSQKDWGGLMIEGNPIMYQRMQQNMTLFPKVKTLKEFIAKDNISGIFKKMGIPVEFDLLSIDIDGNDYWVWQALHQYKPRVTVIEYNAYHKPPERWVMQYNESHVWDGTTYYGASLSSLAALGKKMGYALIGTESMGVNAFFVRQDLLSVSGFQELTPEQAYHPARYGKHFNNGQFGHPFREGKHLKI